MERAKWTNFHCWEGWSSLIHASYASVVTSGLKWVQYSRRFNIKLYLRGTRECPENFCKIICSLASFQITVLIEIFKCLFSVIGVWNQFWRKLILKLERPGTISGGDPTFVRHAPPPPSPSPTQLLAPPSVTAPEGYYSGRLPCSAHKSMSLR